MTKIVIHLNDEDEDLTRRSFQFYRHHEVHRAFIENGRGGERKWVGYRYHINTGVLVIDDPLKEGQRLTVEQNGKRLTYLCNRSGRIERRPPTIIPT